MFPGAFRDRDAACLRAVRDDRGARSSSGLADLGINSMTGNLGEGSVQLRAAGLAYFRDQIACLRAAQEVLARLQGFFGRLCGSSVTGAPTSSAEHLDLADHTCRRP